MSVSALTGFTRCMSKPASSDFTPVVVAAEAGHRHQHHALAPGFATDSATGFVAVQLWQVEVQQHDVGLELLRDADRLESVESRGRFVTDHGEQHRE